MSRRQSASTARKKPTVLLSLFWEINGLEIEHELACAASCFGTRQWDDDFREAWKRQVREATLWKKVTGRAGEVFCEIKDLGTTIPSWHVLRVGEGRMVSMKDTCLEYVNKTLLRHAKNVHRQRWTKKHEIGELKKEFGLNRSNTY